MDQETKKYTDLVKKIIADEALTVMKVCEKLGFSYSVYRKIIGINKSIISPLIMNKLIKSLREQGYLNGE